MNPLLETQTADCNKEMKPPRLFLALASLTAAVLVSNFLTIALAEDWPMFRGPNGSGVSATTGIPIEFGPEQNVVWKTALPPGHSSPVLTRDRIFVTAFEKEKAETGSQKSEVSSQRSVKKTPGTRNRITSFS